VSIATTHRRERKGHRDGAEKNQLPREVDTATICLIFVHIFLRKPFVLCGYVVKLGARCGDWL
jgi:hypothetical protein